MCICGDTKFLSAHLTSNSMKTYNGAQHKAGTISIKLIMLVNCNTSEMLGKINAIKIQVNAATSLLYPEKPTEER